MPGKRFGHCAVLLPDNKYVLVTGGHNGDNYVQGCLTRWAVGCVTLPLRHLSPWITQPRPHLFYHPWAGWNTVEHRAENLASKVILHPSDRRKGRSLVRHAAYRRPRPTVRHGHRRQQPRRDCDGGGHVRRRAKGQG